MRELRGRTALLTGAGGGLGGPIARALAAEGVELALTDLPSVDLEPLCAELRASGARCQAVGADLADGARMPALLEESERLAGPIDILVNNAGIEFAGPFLAHSREELEAIAAVNLVAAMELTRLALPGMIERGRGHVVNIASLAGRAALPYFSSYCATKFALIGFTMALRAEYYHASVGFSAISPGFVGNVGMLARLQESGAPERVPVLGELEPDSVGRAVVKAIRRDVPELIVNRRPMRPLAVLAAASPRAMIRLLNTRRLRRFAEETAKARGR